MPLTPAPPPEQGQLVQVRGRRWVVRAVQRSALAPCLQAERVELPLHVVTLASAAGEGAGGEITVVWEIELAVEVVEGRGSSGGKPCGGSRRLEASALDVRGSASATTGADSPPVASCRLPDREQRRGGSLGVSVEAPLRPSREQEDVVSEERGRRVGRAVELLVQALDRADRDAEGELLEGVSGARVYEAAVGFMLRLAFFLAAEERGLLPLEEPLYSQHYAASTLRDQLRRSASDHGEQVLRRRQGSWSRLLALARGVHGGIRHEAISLPACGGRLFDPDRSPFLEGRARGTTWREAASRSLAVDDWTVLQLLSALGALEDKESTQPQRVTSGGLSVEQLGHIYEGLLDQTARRAREPRLILRGGSKRGVDAALSDLEEALAGGPESLARRLKALTGRGSRASVEKTLARGIDSGWAAGLLAACGGDAALSERVRVFAGFMASAPDGEPGVVLPGRLHVTADSLRRRAGAHYTPRSVARSVVRRALEPLVYRGAERGAPRSEWVLRPSSELLALRICDPACGAGTFLVQACRYLADRLLEGWASAPEGSGLPLAQDREEDVALARRLVAERCLYGVDRDAVAVELARLSLWLTVKRRDRPFTFLDHRLRVGDSLLGCSRVGQLESFELSPELGGHDDSSPLRAALRPLLAAARAARLELEEVSASALAGGRRERALRREVEVATRAPVLVGDLLVGAYLAADPASEELELLLEDIRQRLLEALRPPDASALTRLRAEADRNLSSVAAQGARCFHWPVEFPEVFGRDPSAQGFDAVLANPPFGNAIEAETSRSSELSRFAKHVFQPFAVGAYDSCLLFWARTFHGLLAPRGSYGILGPTALLSDTKPWQRWLHERWRPRFLQLHPVDQFAAAQIRTTAFVGRAGTAATVRVLDLDRSRVGAAAEVVEVPWPDPITSWYEATALSAGSAAQEPQIELGLLSDLLQVGAGCATGAAYELSPCVVDDRRGAGQLLVTTGLLDRFECHWGRKTVRYLKRDYEAPRWPAGPGAPPAVSRASSRQAGQKILVGGLTAVLEAWLDVAGESAGVVSTWVVRPKDDEAYPERLLWRAVGLLNSATFTRIYMSRYGAKALSGRQTTIQKKALLAMPVPPDLSSAPVEGLSRPRLSALGAEAASELRSTAASLLEAASRRIQVTSPTDPSWQVLDRAIHCASGALYGLPPAGARADYELWCGRCRQQPDRAPWEDVVRRLLPALSG